MLKIQISTELEPIWVQSWAAYHPTADAHEQYINVPAGTVGSDVDGKYFTFHSAGDAVKFAGRFDVASAAEASTILCAADISKSLGGKYLTLKSPTTGYYVWVSNGEKDVATVTATAEDANTTLNETYFTFYALDANNGVETKWGVWFNTAEGGTEPVMTGVTPVTNAIEVEVGVGDLIAAVAEAIRSAIQASDADVVESGAANDIVITQNYYGALTASATDTGTSGLGMAETNAGVDDSTDPEVADHTAVMVRVDEDSANTVVATAIKNALDALDDFGASVDTATVTVTNADTGLAVDIDKGTLTTFTVTVTAQGYADVDDSTDIPYTTDVTITVLPADTNEEIATKIASALDALDDFGATASSEVVTVVNAADGECTLASNETTSFTYSVKQQGSSGPVPGTTSGDWIKIVGKVPNYVTTPEGLITNTDRFTPVTKYVPASSIIEVVETDN